MTTDYLLKRLPWSRHIQSTISATLVLAGLAVPALSLQGAPNSQNFQPQSGGHVTRASAGEQFAPQTALPDANNETSTVAPERPMPPTRGSFMAVWPEVAGAAGYRLDVAHDAAFTSPVGIYRKLDVGNVQSQIVGSLRRATRYHYRAIAYDGNGNDIGTSQAATASTLASSSGLVITPTFDTSVTRDRKAVSIESVINSAIAKYQPLFSDPVNVSILFRYATTTPQGSSLGSALAQSYFTVYNGITWETFINALRSDARTSNDNSAVASIPFGPLTWDIVSSSANGRAVGLDTPGAMFADGSVAAGGSYDGIVTLNSSQSFQFTRPTSSTSYDAQRAVEHEMDEVLGLGSYLNNTNNSNVRPEDLFTWASQNSRNTSTNGIRYFSANAGATNIVGLNQTSGYDYGDWLSAPCPQSNPYVQNAFGCKGQADDVRASSPEGIALDIIGYDLVAAVATPSPPVAEAAINETGTSFVAKWQATPAAGYKLDVSADSTFSTFVPGYQNADAGNGTTAYVNGLDSGVTYYYRVRAYNATGSSANSNVISVTTVASTPTPSPTATPTPTSSPTPTATATPTTTPVPSASPTPSLPPRASPSPTASPGPDISVTLQNTVLHDGNNRASPVVPPLIMRWQQDLSAAGVQSISYPLIVNGLVVVTTTGQSGNSLIAFDESTGQEVWSTPIAGTYGFTAAAYDFGKVFVINFSGRLQSFALATGAPGWSVQLSQYSFSSPPTASNGIVYVGGAGSGGTLYAVDEANGNLLWWDAVSNGDHSSPAVADGSVFVSYACPQSDAFDSETGIRRWHYSGPCAGGGGDTAVVHYDRVYVRDAYFATTNGLILNANTGTELGGFSSDRPPAFASNLAVYLSGATLSGVDISNGEVLWTFAGDGHLTSSPLIVNDTIYIGSSSGMLYALSLDGAEVWSGNVGASIPSDAYSLPTGLGAGDRLIVVPTGNTLVAYEGSQPATSPTPTPSATPPPPRATPTPTASAVPKVQSLDATNITSSSAQLNGMVLDDGGGPIDGREFIYGLPGGTMLAQAPDSVNGNTFALTITSLAPETDYLFRAAAHNNSGFEYGLGPGWGGGIAIYLTTAPAPPTISPAGGTFRRKVVVRMSASSTTKIHYTLDGSDPTDASPTYVTGRQAKGITISGLGPHTLRAIATRSGVTPSMVATATFVI